MRASGYRVAAGVVALCAAAFPAEVFAASIVINEIAWMGSAASPNHEWIELYNSGAASVELSGWTLTASDGTPSISLQGSIASGGLFLLERTSDDTVPGIAADQLYTGALGNTGETLLLKNGGGETIDTVNGGADWADIGGNNTTKETAQRAAIGWVTATATPRAVTASFGISSGAPSGADGAVSAGASGSPPSAFSPTPVSSGGGSSPASEPSIRVRASIPQRGIAGADALFSGEALGLKDEPLQNARFRWSFGDGGSAEGKKTFHGYHYPGVYAVFLDVSSGEASAAARGDIAVVPAKLRVSRVVSGSAGLIEIANDDTEEINLSFWHLRSGASFFTIPANTVLLPKRAVPFSSAITKLSVSAGNAVLLYPNGSEAVRYETPPETIAERGAAVSVSSTFSPPSVPAPPVSDTGSAPFIFAGESEETGETAPLFVDTALVVATVTQAASGSVPRAAPWFVAAAGLIAVSVGGYIFAVRIPQKEQSKAEKLSEEAEEFDILE